MIYISGSIPAVNQHFIKDEATCEKVQIFSMSLKAGIYYTFAIFSHSSLPNTVKSMDRYLIYKSRDTFCKSANCNLEPYIIYTSGYKDLATPLVHIRTNSKYTGASKPLGNSCRAVTTQFLAHFQHITTSQGF